MKLRGRHVILSLVLLVSGFLVAISYENTKQDSKVVQVNDQEWEKDYYYRQQLINLEEKNLELKQELENKRKEIQKLEEELGGQTEKIDNYVDRKLELQMITGELPVIGKGVRITLSDADYVPSEENANQYIVHERHIHRVVNELLSAGAEAVSINGQRVFRDSFINCVGPVISVDGVTHPAPFSISAIGDQEVLYSSINLTDGLVDELINDNIEVEMEKMENIQMSARVDQERG
ncbi:DUF881 domain-containing protein [Sediminibacillus dalangtanensis]|uniref:DUF881 domain-containing protein n=1 Tax=Sediminibacillus dalangtanensis TaxID=2729421 RepID=UPI001FD7295C|nr:DUF881 domain-containing protein [Sediminibacillus dalangtanensis]